MIYHYKSTTCIDSIARDKTESFSVIFLLQMIYSEKQWMGVLLYVVRA